MSVEVRMKVGDISAMFKQPNVSTHSASTNVNVNLDSGSTSLTIDSAQVKLSSVALYNEFSGLKEILPFLLEKCNAYLILLFRLDIDECKQGDTHPCNQQHGVCTNYVGYFTCTCEAGFTGNGYNCTGIRVYQNHCFQIYTDHTRAFANFTFNSSWNSLIGLSQYLLKMLGILTMRGDLHQHESPKWSSLMFVDINECVDPAAPGCSINQTCTNSIGSYICDCKTGYKFDPSSGKCLGKGSLILERKRHRFQMDS